MPERLADHTTLHLGGPATTFVTATTDDELVAAVSAAYLVVPEALRLWLYDGVSLLAPRRLARD